MSLFQCILTVAAACLLSAVSADDGKEFPLVWICLGITVVGVAIVLYVAHRRPAELHLPGMSVMTAYETHEGDDACKSAHSNCEPAV